MSLRLPLYPDGPPRLAMQTAEARPLDKSCTRCELSKRGVSNVCMSAEGTPGVTGGLLVVSDYPGKAEDREGRPFVSKAGDLLRRLLAKHWTGHVTLDNILRCAPGERTDALEKSVDACRGYLTQTLRELKPDRVLVMGKWAIYGALGYKLAPFDVRRGYTWMEIDGRQVPVFFLMNPAAATRNRFIKRWLEEDLPWALTTTPRPPAWKGIAWVVRTKEDADLAVRACRSAPWTSFDVETAGRAWRPFQVVSAACTPKGSDDAYVWDVESLDNPETLVPLQELVRDPSVKKVGANIKYDQHSSKCGLTVPLNGVISDVRLLRKIMDPEADADLGTMAHLVGMGGHKGEAQAALIEARKRVTKAVKNRDSKQLSFLADDHGDVRADIIKDIRPTDEKDAVAYGFLPRDLRSRYNGRDTVSAGRLQELLDENLAQEVPQIERTWNTIVMPAALAVQQVEEWGIAIDNEAINAFHRYLETRMNMVRAKLQAYGAFNPDSTKEVGILLYDKLGIPCRWETGKGGRRVDAEALEEIAKLYPQHPVVHSILEWRGLAKMDSTYALGMMAHVRGDGRIHPSLLIDGARSGRLSCTDPNLQNIPRDSDSAEGKMARNCFYAEPGKVLLSADYSQLELRIAAMLSGDENMLAIFAQGGDFHRRTAEMISKIAWNLDPSQVEKKHRTAAKSVNFGLLYGQGDDALAAQIGGTADEAARVRAAVLGNFPKLAAFIEERLQYAERNGICWTWWAGEEARRRPLWRIADDDSLERSRSKHSAHNTPIQGTGSDFCLMSLIEAVRWIQDDGVDAKLVLPIHDALLFEVDRRAVAEVAHTVREIMMSWNSMGVPLEVDIDVGPAWGSLEKYHLEAA